MNKILRNILIVIMISLFGTCYSYSIELCDNNCTQPYSNELTMVIHRTCPLEIKYQTRICNGVQEIRITKIRVLTDTCRGMSGLELHRVALAAIVLDNPMNFTPGKWRISKSSCWRFVNPSTPTELIPCPGDCCSSEVIAELTTCGTIMISGVRNFTTGACPAEIDPQCDFICDPFVLPTESEVNPGGSSN